MTSVLTSYPVVTLAQAKTWLGFSDDEVSQAQQTVIEELINAATEMLEDRIGRKLKSQTITDEVHTVCPELKIDSYGRQYYTTATYLQLDNFPVISITSIKFDDVTQTITEGASTGFYYTAPDLLAEGKIYFSGGWPVLPRTIKVTYVAGWSTVPYKFQTVAKQLILFLLHTSQFETSRNLLINSSSDGTKSIGGTPTFRSLEEFWTMFEKELEPYIV